MAKELPYFKFYPSEWLEGSIFDENDKTQALFVRICAYYWKKDCTIDLKFINKRLINGKATLKQGLENLILANILKVDKNQAVKISFLDSQYIELLEKRKKLSDAGRIGGKATVKHRLSYIDIDKYKDKDLYTSIVDNNGNAIPEIQQIQIMERFIEMAQDYPLLLTLKNPLTPVQYYKLCNNYGRERVIEKMQAAQTYEFKYQPKDANLIIIKWCKKDVR